MNETKSTPQQVVKKEEKGMEYIPFGSQDKIRLTIAIVRDTICTPTKSGALPDDRHVIKFMMMCQAQRLNPFAGDAYLVGYDGKDGAQFSLITAQQALLKRAEVSEDFEGMQSGLIVADENGVLTEIEGDFFTKDQEVVGGWAKVFHRKRKGYPFYKRIRLERFNNGRAQWAVDAAGMICKCAEADALRSAFPTMLGGLYIAGEQTIPVDIESTVTGITGRQPRKIGPATQEEMNSKVEGERQQEEKSNARSPQQELATVIFEAGFTFSHFQKWAQESGQLENADSLPDFDAVPSDVAARLLRAKTGLLKGLAVAKGGA